MQKKYIVFATIALSLANCFGMDDDPFHNSSNISRRKAEKFMQKVWERENIKNKPIKNKVDQSAPINIDKKN